MYNVEVDVTVFAKGVTVVSGVIVVFFWTSLVRVKTKYSVKILVAGLGPYSVRQVSYVSIAAWQNLNRKSTARLNKTEGMIIKDKERQE